MNFNENDLWRDKTKLLNLRFSELHSAKVLHKLEFDTKDQVLYSNVIVLYRICKAVLSLPYMFIVILVPVNLPTREY